MVNGKCPIYSELKSTWIVHESSLWFNGVFDESGRGSKRSSGC